MVNHIPGEAWFCAVLATGLVVVFWTDPVTILIEDEEPTDVSD